MNLIFLLTRCWLFLLFWGTWAFTHTQPWIKGWSLTAEEVAGSRIFNGWSFRFRSRLHRVFLRLNVRAGSEHVVLQKSVFYTFSSSVVECLFDESFTSWSHLNLKSFMDSFSGDFSGTLIADSFQLFVWKKRNFQVDCLFSQETSNFVAFFQIIGKILVTMHQVKVLERIEILFWASEFGHLCVGQSCRIGETLDYVCGATFLVQWRIDPLLSCETVRNLRQRYRGEDFVFV